MTFNEADIVIVGAGVVGLAIAAELAKTNRRIFIIERNRAYGLETSSHNSEVIHSGIYYPDNSLQAKLCVEANPLLYELCEKYRIGCKRLTKIIVACSDMETKEIERLYNQGVRNGVPGLQILTGAEIRKLEPNVNAVAGIFSPTTGVIDTCGLMDSFYARAYDNGVSFVYNAEVIGIERQAEGYKVSVKEADGISSLTSTVVVNSAGLYCDEVARSAGIDIEKAGYKLHWCKGEYFGVKGNASHLVTRLIYPEPGPDTLGIHITINLEGKMKLDPNAWYVNSLDYSFDETYKQAFFESARRYLPALMLEDMASESTGIRPKLKRSGVHDFIIRDEADKGLPGLINLIGIESPGLTSSPSIARYVAKIIQQYE